MTPAEKERWLKRIGWGMLAVLIVVITGGRGKPNPPQA